MARLFGPDMGSRLVVLPSGYRGAGLIGTVYSNAGGTVLADILAYQPSNPTVPGAAIVGSVITTDAYGLLPLFWFPDSVDIVWISVNGGPVTPINADYDTRLDAIGVRVTAIEPAGSAVALRAGANLSDLASVATARTNLGVPPTTRTIIAGTGLTGGGDLSLDRTLTVAYGTTIGTATQGNDVRLSDARTPTLHAATHVAAGADPVTLAESQVTNLVSDLAAKASSATVSAHLADVANPHATTKAQVGLGSVDNTADVAKPVSTAQQTALNLKASTTHATTHQPGGADPMAVDAAVGVGSLRTLGIGSTQAAPGDDTRITGAQQRSTLTVKGDLYVATASGVTTRLAAGPDGQILTADSAQATGVKWAAPMPPVVRSAFITTGDILVPNNAAWTVLPGLSLAIPAVVGEWIELSTKCMMSFGGSTMFYSLIVTSAGSIVRYSSSGSATPAPEGDPGMYPSPGTFRTMPGVFGFTVGAGDLNAGNVTFGWAYKGTSDATAKVYASVNYPFWWRAMNYHVVG